MKPTRNTLLPMPPPRGWLVRAMHRHRPRNGDPAPVSDPVTLDVQWREDETVRELERAIDLRPIWPSSSASQGIEIETRKLPFFERHLRIAGYTVANAGHIANGTLLLQVQTDDLEALVDVVKAANTQAERKRR